MYIFKQYNVIDGIEIASNDSTHMDNLNGGRYQIYYIYNSKSKLMPFCNSSEFFLHKV